MKKSSFLHNPKDMLSKSFKPAKCKMSLKLAASRLKLLKNKKEVQVKQMKRELAQLLDSGQDQTARIRVEHVIREEKMMAAYDLIEIYCELIVARLPIIESQKNCPIDLKEAITSVIFASPRCGDIPELLDVRKHLTAKYGKEFASAAIELRPECGVSRMLVEKLSAKAPDGQAKIKVLTTIAEEHNIKWDPKAFGESEAQPNDLLNGPSTIDNSKKLHAESPYFVPDVQAPPGHQEMHNQFLSSSEQNVRSSHGSQNFPTQYSGVSNVVSSISQPQQGVSGPRADMGDMKQQEFRGEHDAVSFSQQSWNMDFKDATAAAQAAAESAERASMAARAAAELSSRGRIERQHLTGSQKSDHVRRDGGTRKHSTSRITNDYCPKDSANVSIAEPHPRVPKEQNTKFERSYQDDHDSAVRSTQTFSSRLRGSFDKDPFVHNVHRADENSQESLSKEEEMGAKMEVHSDKSDAKFGNLPESFSTEKFDYYGEERTKKHSSSISGSHSSISGGEDENLSSGNIILGPDFGDDHSDGFHGHMQEDSLQSNVGGAIFDESGSDGEDFGLHMGSHHEEFHVPSPDRNLTAHLYTDTGARSLFDRSKPQERSRSEDFIQRNPFQEFSGGAEATIDSSQPDDLVPVTFDDSDGQNSEEENDMSHSRPHGRKDSGNIHGKESLSLGSTRSSFAERNWKKDQITSTTVGSPQKVDSAESPTSHSSPRLGKFELESNDSYSEVPYQNSGNEVNRHDSSQLRSSLVCDINDEVNTSHSCGSEMDEGNFGELNFGKLTGGFRQKGNTLYVRDQLDNVSSSWKGDEESPIVTPQSKASPVVQSSISGDTEVFNNARRSRLPISHYDLDSDSSEEEFEKQPSNHAQESYVQSTGKDVKAKSNSRVPVTYFHSDSSDSEDDSARQVSTGRSRFGTGISRRTKAPPSSTGSISHPKGHPSSVVLDKSDSAVGRNPMTNFYGAQNPQPSHFQGKHSSHMQLSSSGILGSKTTMESKMSSSDKNRDSYGAERPLNSKQTPETSGNSETHKKSSRSSINREDIGKKANQVHQEQKAESSDKAKSHKKGRENSISREDSGKKASHVHPKLPDYDTLAARIQALRTHHE